MRFLIVDSSHTFSQATKAYFEKKDIEVDSEEDYHGILENVNHMNLYNYDAFILSISLKDQRGLNLLEYLNLIAIDKPVIFIDLDHSIKLLSTVFMSGAEEYLSMPFDMKELELRVMKAIRKRINTDEIALPNDHSYIFSEHSIAYRHLGIDLTRKQKELLYLLITHKNALVTYEMILEHVYSGKFFTNNAIATHIRDIKKKVEGIPIKAVKGEGYILKL